MSKPSQARRAVTVQDRELGLKIRQARIAKSMSQETLGKHLGITFQQIQKYEKGVNRVGASRLLVIAGVLEKRIDWFLPAQKPPYIKHDAVAQVAATTEGLELINAFGKIESADTRRLLRDLVVVISGK